MIRIALIGDRNDAVTAHRAIPHALSLAGRAVGAQLNVDWLHTSTLLPFSIQGILAPYSGVWCVPASPYENTEGAIAAIRFARERSRPFLGTCGGFQHALLEYAAAVWGVRNPAHAETDPAAADPVIAPLECSLVEVSESLSLVRGSRLGNVYGAETITEGYHCNYGLNPHYAERLESGPLQATAHDSGGSVRAVELSGHPFFVATLFQPERAALADRTPPIVEAFVRAAAEAACTSSGLPAARRSASDR